VEAEHYHGWVGPLEGRSIEIATENLGFTPDQRFRFVTGRDAEREGEREIVRGTLAVCQAIEGDAVLLFNGETALYERRTGVLYLNSLYWEGDYSWFSPPYDIKAIPVY
jgi:hypothetical protein